MPSFIAVSITKHADKVFRKQKLSVMFMFTKMITTALLLAAAVLTHADDVDDVVSPSYGVDASFPIHHDFLSHSTRLGSPQDEFTQRSKEVFGNDRIEAYTKYISGCIEHYARGDQSHLCRENEQTRYEYNRFQPRGMQNHTEVGFKKVRLSDKTWTMLKEYWNTIKAEYDAKGEFPEGMAGENWPAGNTYVNYWEVPTSFESIQLNQSLTEILWKESERHLRKWIPHAQIFTRSDIYGIRIYRRGHILAPHVDRDPLISSVIINVDQDLDGKEDWPLEVYDHNNGRAHNVTIKAGEAILYESHTVIHGRPFPFQGKYYANIFVHFKPFFTGFEDWVDLDDESEGEL